MSDLFTKALLTTTFRKLIHDIGMRYLRDLWRRTIHTNLRGSLRGGTLSFTMVLSH